jgi:hypothetical protein
MKFFTPELYAHLNSSDDEEFERANAEWHSALKKYRENLEALWAIMPNRTRDLATKYQFHDSQILSMHVEASDKITWSGAPSFDSRRVEFFIFSLLSEFSFVSIFYVLSKPIDSDQHKLKVFSDENVAWLYDEVRAETSFGMSPMGSPSFQMGPPAVAFAHDILLSNGMEIKIPFSEVFINSIPLSKISSDKTVVESESQRRLF